MFSILGDVRDATVLDLYAGSGALGIEALSRGASQAVFVDVWKRSTRTITENLTSLDLGDVSQVLALAAKRAGPALSAQGPFDLVLCDPPWSELADAVEALESLAAAGAFASGARLVLEHASTDEPTPECVQVETRRRWGDTAATFGRITNLT